MFFWFGDRKTLRTLVVSGDHGSSVDGSPLWRIWLNHFSMCENEAFFLMWRIQASQLLPCFQVWGRFSSYFFLVKWHDVTPMGFFQPGRALSPERTLGSWKSGRSMEKPCSLRWAHVDGKQSCWLVKMVYIFTFGGNIARNCRIATRRFIRVVGSLPQSQLHQTK